MRVQAAIENNGSSITVRMQSNSMTGDDLRSRIDR